MSSLPEWLADEDRAWSTFRAGPGPGVADIATVRATSGLDFLQAMLRGEVPYAPIAASADFFMLRAEPGRAVFQGTPRSEFYNPMGTVHGGWIATLLDSALACAVHTTLAAGRGLTTTDLNVKMVRALTPRTARVRAEGQVVHVGRQIATAEARLVEPDGELYAHASTTCVCFELPA